jgi:hypothetical protein
MKPSGAERRTVLREMQARLLGVASTPNAITVRPHPLPNGVARVSWDGRGPAATVLYMPPIPESNAEQLSRLRKLLVTETP